LVAFPLILTFSRWEKERPLGGFVKSVSSQAESRFAFTKTLGAFLPLPAGEGRGEGEHGSTIPNHSSIENVLKLMMRMTMRTRMKKTLPVLLLGFRPIFML
jgi:hypothetical protein